MEEKILLRIVQDELSFTLDGIEYHLQKTKHLDHQYDDPSLNYYIGRKDACEHILKELERYGIR